MNKNSPLTTLGITSLTFESSPFRVGKWLINPTTAKMSTSQETKKIPPKELKLLILLCENYGEVVTRQQIFDNIWPNTIVTGESISRVVADLRKTFNDSGKKSNFISTISKQGYKLNIEPQLISESSSPINNFLYKTKYMFIIALAFLLFAIILAIKYSNKNDDDKIYIKHNLAVIEESDSTHVSIRHPNINNSGTLVVSDKLNELSSSIWIYDTESDTERKLFEDTEYNYLRGTFSNDGKQLAYLKLSNNTDKGINSCAIEIYNFISNTSKKIGECGAKTLSTLSWLKGDKEILSTFHQPENKKVGYGIINIETSEITELSYPQNNGEGYFFPQISPSGNKIAFVFNDSQLDSFTLAVTNRNDSTITHINNSQTRIQQVVWGKDDNELYYANLDSAQSAIWKMNLNSNDQKMVLNEAIVDFDYDENNDFFIATTTQINSSLWQIENSKHDKINTVKSEITHISNNHSGTEIFYVSNRGGTNNIWRKSKENNEIKKITNESGDKYFKLSLSLNDKYLAYTVMKFGNRYLTVVNLENDNKQVYQADDIYDFSWSKTDSNLLYIYEKSDKKGIYEYNINNQLKSLIVYIEELNKFSVTKSGKIVIQQHWEEPLILLCCNITELKKTPYSYETLEIPLPNFMPTTWKLQGDNILIFDYKMNFPTAIRSFSLQGEELFNIKIDKSHSIYLTDFSYDSKNHIINYINRDNISHSLIKLSPYSN